MATITTRQAAPAAGAEIPVHDPATGELIGSIPAGDADAAGRAVARAAAARTWWGRTAPADRGAALREAAGRLRGAAERVAALQTRENGRPIGESRAGVQAGIGTLETCAELATLHQGHALRGRWDALDVGVREPRGVAAAIVPWNDPVAIACGAIGACLAAGNTLVLKPSERTPLSSMLLADVLGLPEGVLTVALGDERMGRPLAAHPQVDVVVFVGSVEAGREVAVACAGGLRKAVLELGGKDPLIVDAGVDPAWAAAQAASGAFANAGQVCTSVERIYVHRDVAGPFLDALVAEAAALRLGPGSDEATTMGPLVDERQREVVSRHVRHALDAGARALTGGRPEDGPGSFYPPTVLDGCTHLMPVMREETFGPVAACQVVDTFDQALALAGDTSYGLAATVLTPSQAHALHAARRLPVGTVKVNAVWGGAPAGSAQPRRGSGEGFGYGPGLMDEVTVTKVVHLEAAPPG